MSAARAARGGRSWLPGSGYRVARRVCLSLAFVAILVAPVLGGWQRLDRAGMANWNSEGAELPAELRGQLPLGRAPAMAYELNQLVGGGAAVAYFDIPLIDPVAGAVALLASPLSLKVLVAFVLPLLLALLAGRVFCGWFCPFGTVARAMASLFDRLPPRLRPRHYVVPESRPVRWVLLGAVIAASLLGVHTLLYLTLPHLLLQQTVYAAWLLGGGSALLGLFLGLLIAAAIFGPTTYCAAICPTGALLSLVARKRVVRLQLASPAGCGEKCINCDRACWLQLDPASGDPGPDCDLCTRCFAVCRETNLRVGLGAGGLRHQSNASAAAIACLALAVASGAHAEARPKPTLVVRGEQVVEGVTVAATVVDMNGVRLAADSDHEERGIELSVFVARGTLSEPDDDGQLAGREVYEGPLTVRLRSTDGRALRVEFDEPNYPTSTPKRSIYRRRLDFMMDPGAQLTVEPIAGWLSAPARWRAPDPGVAPTGEGFLGFLAIGLLAFMGLLSMALGARPPGRGRRLVRGGMR